MRSPKKQLTKDTMILIQTVHPNYITLHTGKQGVCSAEVGALAPVFENSDIESRHNLHRCKNIFNIAKFNVKILNTINQLSKQSRLLGAKT